MKYLIFFPCILCFLFLSQNSFSQSISAEVISNSGEHFKGKNVSLDWTLGESVTDVLASSPYIHTQGFHQTYLTNTNVESDIQKSVISVYPNPVKDFVNVKFKKVSGNATIEVYDSSGRKLLEKEENSPETFKLNMQKYADGKYLFRVTTEKTSTFGIIKSSK